MKKFISLFSVIVLTLCMIVPIVPGEGVYASDYSLSVTSDAPVGTVYKNQIAKAFVTIRTAKPMTGARVDLFVDGMRVENAGSPYFVLYGENKEVFDFVVPSNLDPAYIHTLGIELVDDNGNKANCYQQFRVSTTPPDIKMSFASVPAMVNRNTDLYYTIDFSTPAYMQSHAVNVRFEINGTDRPELDEVCVVTTGTQLCKKIPAAYVNAENPTYTVTVKLNPDVDPYVCHNKITSTVPTVSYSKIYFDAVKAKINPVVIPAQIMKDTTCYSYANLTGKLATLSKGTMVEYMNPDSSESMKAAKVKTAKGNVYWVPMSDIYISREDFTKADNLSYDEKEIFVNGMGYSSSTPYLIWVHKECQRLNVFIGEKGKWKILNSFPVATGTNLTPTPTVVCKYEYSTRWVEEEYICSPVLALYDGYAIHNQPVSHSGYITDRTIGKPASHGCIRMLQKDVDWLYLYVPKKTTVVLY